MSGMADAIHALALEKGISEDLVKQTIENSIKAAYKKAFGTDENCIVKFADDLSDVKVYARKTIVDGVYDPHLEIELEDALKLSSECEVGDEIDILVDPKDFGRYAVIQGKQTAHQGLSESFKENLYNEYKDKVGEQIIGYIQREYNKNIYVDLGNDNKVEGVLPEKYRSPREIYEKGGRIKALITEIKRTNSGIQLILSRTDPRLVQDFLEAEVPELSDGTVEIKKIVRKAGYRTKIAVSANNPDVDPVGSCVGKGGSRIQNVIQQLDGEKIDVIPYDEDPHIFIANALSPAKVMRVIVLSYERREALAIVSAEELPIAIGIKGQNASLANRLVDWNINVKTEEDAAEMDLLDADETNSKRAVEELFASSDSENAETPVAAQASDNAENAETQSEEEGDEDYSISSLPGISDRLAQILKRENLDDISEFVDAYEEKRLSNIEDLSSDDIEEIYKIINENVEFE